MERFTNYRRTDQMRADFAEMTAEATMRARQNDGMARLFERLAERLVGNQRVGDVFTADEIRAIWEELNGDLPVSFGETGHQ